MMKIHITASIADFAGLVDERISGTVMIAGCASMRSYLMITTARLGNTCPTVLSAKKICFRLDPPLMKCPADMQFIGTVSEN